MAHWQITEKDHDIMVSKTKKLVKVMLSIATRPLTLEQDIEDILEVARSLEKVARKVKERAHK